MYSTSTNSWEKTGEGTTPIFNILISAPARFIAFAIVRQLLKCPPLAPLFEDEITNNKFIVFFAQFPTPDHKLYARNSERNE
mgnify:CR=1 FL=1